MTTARDKSRSTTTLARRDSFVVSAVELVRRKPDTIAVILLILASILISGMHTARITHFSPIDELQHVDYLFRAPEFIRAGDFVQQDAMREQACRGGLPYPGTPPCETEVFDPLDFQENGVNTAAVYTPLYYTVTRVLATPLTWIPGIDSLVTAGRLIGGLWLAAGLVLTYRLARRFGAPAYPTTALLLGVAVTPAVIVPAATITPDAAGLLAGAAMVWAVLKWEESPVRNSYIPLVVGALVVLLKALNVLVVALACLYILFRALSSAKRGPESEYGAVDESVAPPQGSRAFGSSRAMRGFRLAYAVVLGGFSLLVGLGYVLISSARAVEDAPEVPMNVAAAVDSFPWLAMLEHVGVFVDVLFRSGWFASVRYLGPMVQMFFAFVLVAGTIGASLLVRGVDGRVRALAHSQLIMGVVGAPLIITVSYLSGGGYFPIPGRHALTLVPVGLILTSVMLQRKLARVIVMVGGFGAYALILGRLLVW